MITIKQFVVNPLQENCYVVSDESGEAVIIDCGCFDESEWNRIKRYLSDNNLTVKHLLNTHLHFDHVLGNRFVWQDFGIKAKANAGDFSIYEQMGGQLRMFFGNVFDGMRMPAIDASLTNGTRITFGTHSLRVLHTPGHSEGGICFHCEEEGVLWAGDTLFENSIGRTDLEGGNYGRLIKSITEKLLTLPDETKVYTGHGPHTTIGNEKRFNPYL